MSMYTIRDHALHIRVENEQIELQSWGPNSLRVRARMSGDILAQDWALLPTPPSSPAPDIRVEGNEAWIRNGRLEAHVTYDEWFRNVQIHYYKDGTLLLEEASCHGGRKLHCRAWKALPGGNCELTVTFESTPDERLYGMGQYQMEEMNFKNCMLELMHHNTQTSVPFVISDRGYGFFWHNPAVGRVTFAKNVTEWQADSTRQMDYWITAGDTPAELVHAYASVTGTVPMMPEYGLGFWQCKLRYWNQAQLLKVAREYKRRGLPIDVIVCDFFHWPRMGDFRFEEEFFPDPAAMVKELRDMGIELMVSVWPQISLKSENYAEMRREGLLVRSLRGNGVTMQFPEDSTFYDATNPRARAYVWNKCRESYYRHGIRIFWLDEAEPEYGVYDFDLYGYEAGPASEVSNLYPQAYARGFYEGMEAEGQEHIVNLIRCAWAGSQRYGALLWSGDIDSTWEDFRRQLCAGLSISLTGLPWWTTDIGGFTGGDPTDPAFRELLVRWFQWGTFCPVMRLHGDREPHTTPRRTDGSEVLFTGADNEVWSFGEEAYPILVNYLQLRETMRDYVRQLMREAHEQGSPVMRAMFYEFPEDKACWELKDQYMFGPDLLVAPVMTPGAVKRSVYLPAGSTWVCMRDGATLEGGQTVEADAPLSCIPVFLRNGAHSEWIGKNC